MKFKIRPAISSDCEDILQLIKQLAIFEKEPKAVKTTLKDLLRDGFETQTPRFHCLIAEDSNRKTQGFALYFLTWSTWEGTTSLYLEDLFVRPKNRGKGLGLELLKALAKIAVEKKCARFEWAVLDWNEPARDFYHSFGAFHKVGWLPYRLEGDNLKKLSQH